MLAIWQNIKTELTQTLLAIGTSYVQGEDVAAKGRIILVSVGQDPNDSASWVCSVSPIMQCHHIASPKPFPLHVEERTSRTYECSCQYNAVLKAIIQRCIIVLETDVLPDSARPCFIFPTLTEYSMKGFVCCSHYKVK